MINRKIETVAKEIWSKYPVLTITGPRQSGKTTLAKKIFTQCEYVNLERPDIREEVRVDARSFLSRHPAPVIFDEIQNVPDLVSYLQVEVDRVGRNSLYVLTGSHQPALQATISQSLAGRTGLLELLPLSIGELKDHGLSVARDELLYSGFMPRLYDTGLDAARLYADYFQTYVERDARQLANLRNLRDFEIFVRLLAGRVGQLLNLDSLASDVGVSATTLRGWLSILETSYIIYQLRPYYRNFGKRFTKAPKIYFTEPGLVAYLLGIRAPDQVATHPLVGNLFENMVVMDLLKGRLNSGESSDLYYMRTNHGVEADVVVERAGKLDLIEIKSASTFHDEMAANLRALKKQLPDAIANLSVIYAGEDCSAGGGIPVRSYDCF